MFFRNFIILNPIREQSEGLNDKTVLFLEQKMPLLKPLKRTTQTTIDMNR